MVTEFITKEDAINAMVRVSERMFWPLDDADDALRGAIDELRKLSPADVRPVEWISVKDRLPDKEEKYYLCYTKGGYHRICLWTDDVFGLRNIYINSDKRFGSEWGWSVHTKPMYDEITHWIPLPEPPKEET